MIRSQILKLLTLMGINLSDKIRSEWVVAQCPFTANHKNGDANPSFAISIQKNSPSKFNCFSCGEHGGLVELVSAIKNNMSDNDCKSALELIAQEDKDILELPDFNADKIRIKDSPLKLDWLNSFPPAYNIQAARDYLSFRGLSVQEIAKYNVRFDTEKQRVCFPYFNFVGKLIALQGRAITEQIHPKYYFYPSQNKTFWYGENWIDPDKTVILVEGVMDAIAVARYYPNVLASAGTAINEDKLNRISHIYRVITFFDADKSGDVARKKVEKHFGPLTKHLIPEGAKDPGGMERKLIELMLRPLCKNKIFDI